MSFFKTINSGKVILCWDYPFTSYLCIIVSLSAPHMTSCLNGMLFHPDPNKWYPQGDFDASDMTVAARGTSS